MTKIPGGLKQDTAVFLQGTVLADAKKYAPKALEVKTKKMAYVTTTVRKVTLREFFFKL